mgnify:CR=1 FL=1
MQAFVDFVLNLASDLGYVGIVLLMTLESCFVPFPSEVVMIPAGYLASRGEMNAVVAVLCGVLGSVLGALINYFICFFWGRAFVLKYGKFVGINEQKFAKFEAFFNKHGEFSTFTCRLLPAIRQYISMPAGLAKMNLTRFVIFTALGSALWVSILVALGYFVGENETLIKEYLHEILIAIVAFVIVASGVYLWYLRKKKSSSLS